MASITTVCLVLEFLLTLQVKADTTLTSLTTARICPNDDVCGDECVNVTDPDGCPRCSCPSTCEDISCELDEECVLQYMELEWTFPQPYCVPKETPCWGNPRVDRCKKKRKPHGRCVDRWTFNVNINACEKFCYYGCTPNPANTFKSEVTCLAKCQLHHW